MNQPARKPGDVAGGKLADSLPVDDPSIPVLTERLTLPPLDLNLDFRLPDFPAKSEDETLVSVAPQAMPHVAPPLAPLSAPPTVPPVVAPAASAEPMAPVEHSDLPGGDETIFKPVDAPSVSQPPVRPSDPLPMLDERTAVAMAGNTMVEREPTDVAPRVPTSLLLSNVDQLLPSPPTASLYRERDEFDLTQSDGVRPNRMESNLREMILLELARRLPTEVEAIVRRHLDGAIEEAIKRFSAEVRIALAGSLREIVDRAVKAELDRLNVPRG